MWCYCRASTPVSEAIATPPVEDSKVLKLLQTVNEAITQVACVVKSAPGISKSPLKMVKIVIFCILLTTILRYVVAQSKAIELVGKAASYNIPSTGTRTACGLTYPIKGDYGAVGPNLWKDGALCGKKIEIKCVENNCHPEPITITVADNGQKLPSKPSELGTDVVLPGESYKKLAIDPNARSINIQYKLLEG